MSPYHPLRPPSARYRMDRSRPKTAVGRAGDIGRTCAGFRAFGKENGVGFASSAKETHSRLQLALELVQKAPIGVFGDDLLWSRFDEPHFVQPQSVKPDRVLGIVFPPFVVWNVAQRLKSVVVAPSTI